MISTDPSGLHTRFIYTYLHFSYLLILEQLQVFPQSFCVGFLIMDFGFLNELQGIPLTKEKEGLADGSLLDHTHDELVVELDL